MLVGITRVRNESLIIGDTVRHFLKACDRVVAYDDCSTDDTVEQMVAAGGDRIEVLCGDRWRTNRPAEETRHRAVLLDRAREMGAVWCLCFDADERLVGDLPPLTGNGFRFRLFDGYLTTERQQPYTAGPLDKLPRMWGPEYRDILMLFRAKSAVYRGLDRREPIVRGSARQSAVMVKHYGKCLSVEQWEETCEYYAANFPEPYRSKWNARRGKAIHCRSDFGRPLLQWDELMARPQSWVAM